MEKEKNYSPSGDGHGDLPSPAEQLAIERNQRLRAEIERCLLYTSDAADDSTEV